MSFCGTAAFPTVRGMSLRKLAGGVVSSSSEAAKSQPSGVALLGLLYPRLTLIGEQAKDRTLREPRDLLLGRRSLLHAGADRGATFLCGRLTSACDKSALEASWMGRTADCTESINLALQVLDPLGGEGGRSWSRSVRHSDRR